LFFLPCPPRPVKWDECRGSRGLSGTTVSSCVSDSSFGGFITLLRSLALEGGGVFSYFDRRPFPPIRVVYAMREISRPPVMNLFPFRLASPTTQRTRRRRCCCESLPLLFFPITSLPKPSWRETPLLSVLGCQLSESAAKAAPYQDLLFFLVFRFSFL